MRGDARYCELHKAEHSWTTTTASRHERGYDAEWEKIRRAHLDANPLCADCQRRGRMRLATVVDHIKPLAKGGTHDGDNLQSLCDGCHALKTRHDRAE